MADVSESGGKFHILLILADGVVSDGVPEARTIAAITEASHYPLSIVCVGVGDGPFDDLEMFDDRLENRKFDNLQFVPLYRLLQQHNHQITPRFEASFALRALMEIPEQYKLVKKLGLLSNAPNKGAPRPAPPPIPERGGGGMPMPMPMAVAPPAAVAPPPGAYPGAGVGAGAGGFGYPAVAGGMGAAPTAPPGGGYPSVSTGVV